MVTSTANVATDAGARYAKQLASHLGRRVEVEELPGGGYRFAFGTGEGIAEPQADRLVLRASAADADGLATIKDVLGRHLERFGQRNGLTVTWQES